MSARAFVVVALLGWCVEALAVSSKDLLGTWEAARPASGDRLYVRLQDKGRAEVIAEYDFQLPGQPTRRGRSTTMAKWTLKGSELTLSYAKVRDRLRYNPKLPLTQIGQPGSAPALEQIGQTAENSRLRGAVLWKAPHEFRLKAQEGLKASDAAVEPKK
jgi:hypothetical protein